MAHDSTAHPFRSRTPTTPRTTPGTVGLPAASLSRRHLLGLGGAAVATGLLAACGGGSDGSAGGSSSDGTGAATGGFTVVQRYPSGQKLVPGEIRLAISLASADGSLLTEGPAVLNGVMRNERGERVDTIAAQRRGTGLSVPYWSITTTIAARGLYDFVLDGAAGDPTPFFVYDPEEVSIPVPGVALAPFDTPTTADPRGVDPICTRSEVGDGPCPFHEVTLTEALASGKPVVYLIGTPAHCATATCGPGLDFLIAESEKWADRAVFVHAEVYADPEATTVAPAVVEYGLDYEPVIWITDAAGTVVRRIDIVWDADELSELMAASLA